MERIQEEAGGWPHLVQLIAETAVDFLNSDGSRAVTTGLMERVLDEAAISGQNVLYQLMRGECSLAGEWEYLRGFREAEEQEVPGDEAVRRAGAGGCGASPRDGVSGVHIDAGIGVHVRRNTLAGV